MNLIKRLWHWYHDRRVERQALKGRQSAVGASTPRAQHPLWGSPKMPVSDGSSRAGDVDLGVRSPARHTGMGQSGARTRTQVVRRHDGRGMHPHTEERTMRIVHGWMTLGVVVLLSVLLARDADAWGDTGHLIMCEIAFQE